MLTLTPVELFSIFLYLSNILEKVDLKGIGVLVRRKLVSLVSIVSPLRRSSRSLSLKA
jgi:hypothetical protein